MHDTDYTQMLHQLGELKQDVPPSDVGVVISSANPNITVDMRGGMITLRFSDLITFF